MKRSGIISTNLVVSRPFLLSLLFSLSLLVITTLILNAIDFVFLTTINRVTYPQAFNVNLFGDPYFENIAALVLASAGFLILSWTIRRKLIPIVAIPTVCCIIAIMFSNTILVTITLAAFIITTIVVHKFGFRVLDKRFLILTFSFLMIIIEILAISRWLMYIASNGFIFNDSSWHFAILQMQLFSSAGMLMPHLVLLASVSYVIVLLNPSSVSKLRDRISYQVRETKVNSKVILLFVLSFSSLISIIPQLNTTNPDGNDIGRDIAAYSFEIEQLKVLSAADILYQTFNIMDGGDRPLTLLFFYSLHIISGIDITMLLRFLPIMLSPSLVFAYYFFMGKIDRFSAVTVAAITAMSFPIVVGIYGGFYANWIANIFSIFSLTFLLRYWDGNRSRSTMLLFSLFSVLALLTHTYTWILSLSMIAIFVVFSLADYRVRKESISKILVIFLIIFGIFSIQIFRSMIGPAELLHQETEIADERFGLENYGSRWGNLRYAFGVFVGGFLTNILLIALALAWIFLRADHRVPFDRFIICTLFLILVPFIVGDFTMQSRIMYNSLVTIPAGIMIATMLQTGPINRIAAIAILLFFAEYTIRALSNMYLVLP